MMQRVAAFLFGFGSYFFLVRYFSVDSFGVWTLYVVVSNSVEMSRSAFIQNAFVKFFNEEGTNKAMLFTGSLLLNFLSTIVFIAALLLMLPLLKSFWSSEAVGILILWYCGTSLVLILFTQLNYLEQANHSFAGVFWSAVVRQGAFFCIVVVAYFFVPGLSLAFFAAAQCLTAFFGLITSLFLTRRMIPSQLDLNWPLVRKLFKFGKYILGTGITSTVGKNADQVILGSVSHTMVALYNSAVRVLNFIEIPSLSISSIVYPKIAERASKEGIAGVGLLYEKSVATILGFILPVIVCVLVFPELVLTLTAGTRYATAAGPLRMMGLASLLIPFNIQIGSVCEVVNKPHVSFYINLFSNILNVILNIVLIRFFGIMGAACAFAITVFFIFGIGQWYMSTQFGIHGLNVFGRIIDFYKNGWSAALGYIKNR
jgi:lipopolysaccharide exporter